MFQAKIDKKTQKSYNACFKLSVNVLFSCLSPARTQSGLNSPFSSLSAFYRSFWWRAPTFGFEDFSSRDLRPGFYKKTKKKTIEQERLKTICIYDFIRLRITIIPTTTTQQMLLLGFLQFCNKLSCQSWKLLLSNLFSICCCCCCCCFFFFPSPYFFSRSTV